MKIKSNFKKVLLLFVMAIALVSCNDDENAPVTQQNIVGLAQATPELSILVQALVKADLVTTLNGNGPFTVLAPTNTAFSAFLAAKGYANLDAVPVPALRQILLNHVVSGDVKANDLPADGYFKTLANFGTSTTTFISTYVNKSNNAVTFNGGLANSGAVVTTADIDASNGTIHIVNGVIDIPTIINHAIANPSLDTLQAVVTSTSGAFGDQSAVLNVLTGATSSSPLTVFAPINAAFTAATTGNGFAVGATPAQVSNVLRYHVVAGANVTAGTLTEGQVVNTALQQTFTITLAGGAQITDKSTPTGATKARIIITDIQASNGVVHAIDKVLQPTL